MMTTPDPSQPPYGSFPAPVDPSAGSYPPPPVGAYPQNDYPPVSYPPAGGYSNQPGGYPAPAFPGGYPAPGYPAAGYPAPGYPAPGYPAAGYPMAGGQQVAPRNGMGTAALVLGIIGILTTVFFLGTILDILAIIFGAVGLSRAKQGTANNRSKAMTGLILGAVALVGYIAFIVYFVATRGTYSFNVST